LTYIFDVFIVVVNEKF